jgi:phosphopentomutase
LISRNSRNSQSWTERPPTFLSKTAQTLSRRPSIFPSTNRKNRFTTLSRCSSPLAAAQVINRSGTSCGRIFGRTMRRSSNTKPSRKAKKSYTLSPESIQFLESLRKKRRAPSISAILEDILQRFRRGQERASVEREIAKYYDSLSAEDLAEDVRWGEFAMREFPTQDRT